ncbi:MAG: hypothetical protein A2017_17480 [Lentisphaerae bacterium GWF2_44_16]|nr:MAG: hypothetical protein A2017_17480 [Lentisphaerae bacterium GWF2_44_16]HAU65895.1 hypothetical protein [Candidatus Uhrbacteria bacterium]
MTSKESPESLIKLDPKIFSSAHINFFLGAGVNGSSFPQMSGFKETLSKAVEYLGKPIVSFESDIESLSEGKKKVVLNVFKKELEKFSNDIDFESASIKDIESMFQGVNSLILESENRTLTMKQVNIYTTNYDCIVEKTLNKIGLLCNVLSSSNLESRDKFFELIGYDYGIKKYIPTFLVSKIHGDIDNPVLPSKNKYDEALEAKRFEILFRMKSQLSRFNSVLIVIGYSGNDRHINGIIKDCLSFGLTVYWFRYASTEKIPDEFIQKIFIIDQPDQQKQENTTKLFCDMVNKTWEKPLEE